jgi:hypothetical protein
MNGRFLIDDGIGQLSAGANFGSSDKKPIIEMADVRITVVAQGDMNIGGILNPALVKNNKVWDNGYTAESGITLTAMSGRCKCRKCRYKKITHFMLVGLTELRRISRQLFNTSMPGVIYNWQLYPYAVGKGTVASGGGEGYKRVDHLVGTQTLRQYLHDIWGILKITQQTLLQTWQ